MNVVARAANRASREVTARVGVLEMRRKRNFDARVARHENALPVISAADQQLIMQLRQTGAARTSMAQLHFSGYAPVSEHLAELVATLMSTEVDDSSTLRPSQDELIKNVSLWQFGLHPRLLDIAENYIGLPVRYYGAEIRREVADSRTVGVRQWHRDTEDHRMLKLHIWLDDVDRGTGPFEFVPAGRTNELATRLSYVSGFVSDQKFDNASAPDERVLLTGPQGTANFVDTANIFHRAAPPTSTDRLSATFTWTSRQPIHTRPAYPYTAVQIGKLKRGLEPRQLDSLPF
jgi:hypothetical protein